MVVLVTEVEKVWPSEAVVLYFWSLFLVLFLLLNKERFALKRFKVYIAYLFNLMAVETKY